MDARLEERRNYAAGRAANLGGRPRDKAQNIDWLRGWDDAQDDRQLDDYEGW